jgi:circadian clock protein KaiB
VTGDVGDAGDIVVGEAADDGRILREFEAAILALRSAHYELTLFVAGASAVSARAVSELRQLCETHLQGRYALHVVDIRTDPALVSSRGVLAAPTLIKDHPLPKRVLVGSLSDTSRVLQALDIVPVTGQG